MKVAVLGAGVIGVTSAWYLRQSGHDVVVIDRQPGPGLETSFANAGELSPGYSTPWAAPGIPMKALRWLAMQHAPLILRPKLEPDMLLWLLSLLSNCTHGRYARNKERMMRLAHYSLEKLKLLRTETAISYDGQALGTLQLFRTQAQLDSSARDTVVLRDSGVAFELLDGAGCIRVEPALAHSQNQFVGGLRLVEDETGDCFKFTRRLAEMAACRGVKFEYDMSVDTIAVASDRVVGIDTNRGRMTAECYVMALGSYSQRLLKKLGIKIPVYPVKGYSLTVPVVDRSRAPVSTLMDEKHKVAITRLGNRIRVGGIAEISGFDLSLSERPHAALLNSLEGFFPGAANVCETDYWCGLRPMTPDGTPFVSPTKL